MGRKRTIDREAVLEITGSIIGEQGFSALTLEAVAAKAGISKGGLQYLFKKKQQLVIAMIEHYTDKISASVRKAYDELPETPGRPLKAYINGNLLDGAMPRDSTAAALLAAVLAEPEYLAAGKQEYRKTLQQLTEQGVDKDLATVVMCAVDGLMFTEFLQVDPYTPAERKRLKAVLLELSETGVIPTFTNGTQPA